MGLLVFALTFLIVIVVFLGIWMTIGTDSKQEVVRRRMEAVRKAERRGEVSMGLKLARDEMLSSVPAVHRLMLHWAWSVRLQERISQAGLTMKAGKLILISACLFLGTAVIVGLFTPMLLVGLLIGICVGLIPYGVVMYLRQKRLRAFEERFPEALDLLGRAVRAGHAFTTGLEMIAKESPEPIASEFRTTFEEQNFGLPLRDALLNMTERIPSIDVRFFVTALLIQKETGGNLAEILDGLARVIRDRFRIYREVRVRTAQGRLTAGILIALPIFMMLVLMVMNPNYMGVLFHDPKGMLALTVAGIMQVIGSLVIWKIIHIEV
jgi:tight adherence protein B